MQIERSIMGVRTLGPGNRLAIWVNGCHRRCKGCVSPRLQKNAPQNECDIKTYFDGFDLQGVDGVTVSGGEPFNQLSELSNLIKYFHDKGIADILIYTGYTLDELLKRNDEKIEYILKNISVLIDGPYIQALDTNIGNLKGSDNQRVIVLDANYQKLYDDYYKDKREMQEFSFGRIVVSAGIPDRKYINAFLEND